VCHKDKKANWAVQLDSTELTPDLLKFLYRTHGAALAAYARCFGLDFASAEDVVQHVFVKLLAGQTQAAQSPLAYLHRAVRNAALNHRRDRRREAELPKDQLWFVHAEAHPAEVLALQNALQELSEEQREAVFLRIWSGMTLKEVAEATETPLNTVASRYRYGLDKLREQLGEGIRKGKIDHAER